MSSNIQFCHHCRNTAPHQILMTHKAPANGYDSDGKLDREQFDVHRYIYECSTCSHISLFEKYDVEDWENLRCVYPAKLALHESIPSQIRETYYEAKRIQTASPNAFAVLIRRCLEGLCDERKVKKGSLATRLASLAQKGEIPGKLADVTVVLRELGNAGAHDLGQKVTVPHTWIMDEFLNVLLEYAYVAPSKLQSFRESLEKNKVKDEPSASHNSEGSARSA